MTQWPEGTRRLGLLGTVLVCAFCTVSCADASRDAASVELPVYVGVVDLEFGEVVGDAPYLFGAVSGLARDSSGRIFVSDSQANEIRVFDGEGAYLFAIGRPGEGPGELLGPCCIAIGADGRLWIRESGNGRYSSFDLTGSTPELRQTVRMNHGAANLQTTTTFDATGRLIDVGSGPNASGSLATWRVYVGPDGTAALVDTISPPLPEEVGMHIVRREVGTARVTFYLYQPFGPRHLIAHGPGGRWAEAVSSAYQVELHGADGNVIGISRPESVGPELTPEERLTAEDELESERQRLDLAANEMPFAVPTRKPPVRALYFDQEGRLWIELNVSGDRRVSEVFNPEGEQLARYEWPERVAAGPLAWIGTEEFIGTTRDSLDVVRVARVRFENRR